MNKIFLFLFITVTLITCDKPAREKKVNKLNLIGMDYRLFQGTVAWELAKAVEDQRLTDIEDYVRDEQIPVDFQETRFGQTILMLAIMRNHYGSSKKLLELGADPNQRSNEEGRFETPMILAAGEKDVKYLRLLLKYGGNVNTVIVIPSRDFLTNKIQSTTTNTPLLEASDHMHYTFEHVKLLVEAGANINIKTEFGHTPLTKSLTLDQMKTVLYLLENGIDYRAITAVVNNKTYRIENELRFIRFPLDSKKHKQKMKVVEWLKKHGVDYRATPIPKIIIEEAKEKYPYSWKEYLEKY